jgi:hypothetical protein
MERTLWVRFSLHIYMATHSRYYSPHGPNLTRLLVVPAPCSDLSPMCITLSQADEEEGSTEFDTDSMDHQGGTTVSNTFFSFLSPRMDEVVDTHGREHIEHYY